MANKLYIAAFTGLLFYVIANPITYTLVDSVFRAVGLEIAISGKPTGVGLVIHSIVFAAIAYILMCV